MSPTTSHLRSVLPQIVKALPQEWRGTTFANLNLLGRAGFAQSLEKLAAAKAASGEEITSEDLVAVGNAEDYMRVSTNISTTLELCLAEERGVDVTQVLTFASTTMPIVAVCLHAHGQPVHLYVGADGTAPFSAAELVTLKKLGGNLAIHAEAPKAHADEVVLALESVEPAAGSAVKVDGVIATNALYIANAATLPPADLLVIRKRMSTPVTTPVAEAHLRKLAGLEAQPIPRPSDAELAAFYAGLQELSGTAVNAAAEPVVCTAGLPTISSFYYALLQAGGADVLMCSTAYGGSNQLTQIFDEKAELLRRHTFDIQGDVDVTQAVVSRLGELAELGDALLPVTVLFMEMPTNPDMKLPEASAIVAALKAFREKTGRQVLYFVDVTFSPGSNILAKLQTIDADLPAMVFVSMSKSISRGKTCAGAVIANHTQQSITLLDEVRTTAKMLDVTAKDDQLTHLVQNYQGVADRCQKAYENAAALGKVLLEAVKEQTGESMFLRFVSPEAAAQGFTTSTFSFNLPAPKNSTQADREALAQDFVDILAANPAFKPCVSFGQDNDLIYATVPATSTQGVISHEDKAKQAADGVQLVRLSYPPTIDRAAVSLFMTETVKTIYTREVASA